MTLKKSDWLWIGGGATAAVAGIGAYALTRRVPSQANTTSGTQHPSTNTSTAPTGSETSSAGSTAPTGTTGSSAPGPSGSSSGSNSATSLGAGATALPIGSTFPCYNGMIEGFPAQYVDEATTLAQQIASEGMGVIARFVDGQNHYLAKGCVVSAVLGSVPYSPQYGFVSRLAAVGVGNPQIWAAANGMTNITVVAQYTSSGGPS